LDNDKLQKINLTRDEWDKLGDTLKFKTVTDADIARYKAERKVAELLHMVNHLKGAMLALFENAPKEIFDEGMARRIKARK
jgi:hypothetical protein